MKKRIKKNLNKIKKYQGIIILLIILSILISFLSYFAPYNMDEFSHYQPIICHHYKYNSLNIFRENCKIYYLDFLNTGLNLPMRAYAYTGSFQSILYYPLFLIWKSPLSARYMGIIFLLIQALILSKIFKIRYEYIFIGLALFFPYSLQHVVDTGPVGFHITSIFIIFYLFNKWFKEIKIIYPILISTTIFLGIWTKLVYFWFLPGILIIFGMNIFENRKKIFRKKHIKKLILHLVISFVVLFALLSLIFLSTYVNTDTMFLNQILHSESYSFDELIYNGIIKNSGVIKALLNPFEATHRIHLVKKPSLFVYIYDFFIYLSVPVIGILILFTKKKKLRKNILWSKLLFLAFLITIFFIIRTKGSWAMHHAVLSFPFLILSFFFILTCFKKIKSKQIIYWFLFFILLNGYCFAIFYIQEVKEHDDYSKIIVNKILYDEYLSKNYFYVIIDWGMYYYQGLYGSKYQSVLYIEPFESEFHEDMLRNLSKQYNRKILFVYNSKTASTNILKNVSFELESCKLINNNSIWNVKLEKDNNSQNICFKTSN